MKIRLIILAIWVGLVTWYGCEYYSIQKEKAEWRAQQLRAVEQE